MVEVAADASSPLAQLRAATREQHQALDHMLSGQPEGWSRARYAALLQGSLAVVEPLSGRLALHLPQWADPRRVTQLEADLACLGVSGAPPAQLALPQIGDASQAFGCAYVIEGSALGGRVIARQLRAIADVPPAALGYLELYGASTRARWSAFTSALEAWGNACGEQAIGRACASARATFSAYAAAIRQAAREQNC